MKKEVLVEDGKSAKDAMIAIGQEIIRQADEICNSLINVNVITINAVITPDEFANVNITKNFRARFKEE